jgi:hypothetical protein
MPTLPSIAPCTHNIPCLKYPCRLANPQVAFAAPIMAGEDQQQNAKVHRCQTFSQTHHPPGFSRWKQWQGQKYFQLLGKLSQDLTVNFTNIIAQCTINTARNNGDLYTEMKDPSCYLQLNLNGHATLSPHTASARGQGHYSSWQSCSASCQGTHPQTPQQKIAGRTVQLRCRFSLHSPAGIHSGKKIYVQTCLREYSILKKWSQEQGQSTWVLTDQHT